MNYTSRFSSIKGLFGWYGNMTSNKSWGYFGRRVANEKLYPINSVQYDDHPETAATNGRVFFIFIKMYYKRNREKRRYISCFLRIRIFLKENNTTPFELLSTKMNSDTKRCKISTRYHWTCGQFWKQFVIAITTWLHIFSTILKKVLSTI